MGGCSHQPRCDRGVGEKKAEKKNPGGPGEALASKPQSFHVGDGRGVKT